MLYADAAAPQSRVSWICFSFPQGLLSFFISSFEFISIKSSAAKEDEPGIMQGTAEVPHQIADAHLL